MLANINISCNRLVMNHICLTFIVCWDVNRDYFATCSRLVFLAAQSEARDRLLSICAASNSLQQQVYCGHVYIQTEPGGYRLITVNETHSGRA